MAGDGHGAYRELVQLPGGGVQTLPWDGKTGTLDVEGTIRKTEWKPGMAPLNSEAMLTSIAISLKRIADRLNPEAKPTAPTIQLDETQFTRLMETLKS
jgi:hypothetical protein